MRKDRITGDDPNHEDGVSLDSWGADGTATLAVTGHDARFALEAGLRAALALAVGRPAPTDSSKSVPVRAEGNDLAEVFAGLLEELLDQIEEYGAGLHDVVIDGVLRRAERGYVAWGYALGALEPAPTSELLRLMEAPTVVEEGSGRIALRARLRRVMG